MIMKTLLLIAGFLALSGQMALATQMQGVPGGGTPAAGGKGPGMGHDYRQNVGGPGIGRGAAPGNASAIPLITAEPVATPAPAPIPAAPPAQATGTLPAPAPPPGLGYPGYPTWAPGMGTGDVGPGQGSMRPGRGQGYGYPGYRGQGGSPYPGHRQYANPPRYPVPAPDKQE